MQPTSKYDDTGHRATNYVNIDSRCLETINIYTSLTLSLSGATVFDDPLHIS